MDDKLRQRFFDWQQDIELCIDELFRKDGYLEPMHIVMSPHGDLSIMPVAAYLNSPQTKELLCSLMAKHIQSKRAVASAMVAESWLVDSSPNQPAAQIVFGKSSAEHPQGVEVVSVQIESFWEMTTILYTINRQGESPHLAERRVMDSLKTEYSNRFTPILHNPNHHLN